MRKNGQQRTLRVKRETLRALTTLSDRALARVAGGSWGIDPNSTGDTLSNACWDQDPQSYSTGSKFC